MPLAPESLKDARVTDSPGSSWLGGSGPWLFHRMGKGVPNPNHASLGKEW